MQKEVLSLVNIGKDSATYFISFVLTSSKDPKTESPKIQTVNTFHIITYEVTEELSSINEDSLKLQLAVFRIEKNALTHSLKLSGYLGKKPDIIYENTLYKVRMTGLKTRNEINEALSVLEKAGITQVWILSLKAKQ